MVEEENNAFFQVEYNLIASSLGPICQGARKVHTTLNGITDSIKSNSPLNLDNTEPFIKAFKAAHKAYGKKEAIIVSIADNGTNKFDQLFPIEDLALAG